MARIGCSRTVVRVLATALLVSVSGCGTDNPEDLDSTATSATTTEATEATEATETTAESTTPAPAPTADTDTSTDVVTARSASTPATAPFGAAGVDGVDGDPTPVRWLVPWEDGFLAIGVRMPPQPLPPELPPEIAELFPPEVDALFPDGLPPTHPVAMDFLEHADLLDAVMQVFVEHP